MSSQLIVPAFSQPRRLHQIQFSCQLLHCQHIALYLCARCSISQVLNSSSKCCQALVYTLTVASCSTVQQSFSHSSTYCSSFSTVRLVKAITSATILILVPLPHFAMHHSQIALLPNARPPCSHEALRVINCTARYGRVE